MSAKTRIIAFFIFVGLFSSSFYIGTMMEVSEEDAALILEEFQALIEEIDGLGIGIHNLSLALPMFIPGFGAAWGLFSSWSTGYAFAALVTAAPQLGEIHPLTLLYMSPFGLMELTAYSIAMSRSALLIIRLFIKKQPVNASFIKPIVIEVGIVIGLLIAAGYIEHYMIELSQQTNFEIF